MALHSADEAFTHRALQLASQGIALASPNPVVGAVLVDSGGGVAGEGVYTYAGRKHAEILALEQAGERSRGATLYINLEPHAHQGRTPPCTDALIAAGVRRVVAAMADPNPKVSGRGFEQLRAAGIAVEVGLLEAEARRLNESFARYIRAGMPFVTLKSAMTLDGKIAPPPGASPSHAWITGESARAQVHQQRHQSDAILAGIGTVLADDPWLTDRSGLPRRRGLLRVILDSRLRLPLDSNIARSVESGTERESDLLLFYCTAEESKRATLQARGIRLEQLPPCGDGRLSFPQVLRRLAELEITSVLVEGGSRVNAAALAAGAVDKLFLYYAPKLFAEAGSIPFASHEVPGDRRPALQLSQIQLHRFGEDFAVEGYLRDPYAAGD